jgi:hypothetical protein
MAPVDELVRRVSSNMARNTGREMELVQSFSKDQLQYALIELMGLLRREQGLTKFLYSGDGRKHVAEIAELKQAAKAAGFDLWPECPAGR